MANSPARSVIDVGSVIDKYVIEALIGRGGMGAVFLARHRTLTDKKVAIKVLHAEILDADIQLRFKREAQIATKVNHPNIVEVHDFDVTPEGVPYLVLEYLEGQTLAQRIAHGPIPLEQVNLILRQVGSALAAAHREGITHRDLKPQNIFLVPMEVDGRVVEVAKVLDFGISKWRGSETVKTQESALLGTPQYMAPEQATGRHDSVDQRTDVFALGAIVYEMLCGQPAFTGASIPEVVFKVVYEQPAPIASTVPDHVAAAIKKAMSKQSDERFADVSQFVEAITGSALTTFRPSMVTKPPGDIGFASGSKKISNPDALGETMGSGDYGSTPPTTPVPVATPVRASSPTVDSVSRPDVTLPTPPAPAPRKRPVALMIAGGLGLAVAAVVVVLATRGGKGKTKDTKDTTESKSVVHTAPADAAVQVAQATPDAAVAVPPAPPRNPNEDKVGKAIDEAVTGKGSADRPAKDPKKNPPTPPRPPTPPPPPIDEDPDEGDDDVKANLVQARDAFSGGDLDRALTLANKVANRGGPRQRAQAALIQGKVACQRRDIELVNQALNRLGSNPAMRRQVVSLCRSKGLDGIQ